MNCKITHICGKKKYPGSTKGNEVRSTIPSPTLKLPVPLPKVSDSHVPFLILYAYANVHMQTQYRAFRKHADVLAGYIATQFAHFISPRHGGPLLTIAHGGGPSVSFEPMNPSLFHEGVHPPEPGWRAHTPDVMNSPGRSLSRPHPHPQGGAEVPRAG